MNPKASTSCRAGDADDGYDAIDWLSKQDWSNGRIGTYGCSYMGDVQIIAAQRRHPALKAMIPQAAGSSIGSAGGQYKYFGARLGGAVQFAQNVSWFYDSGSKVFYHPPPGLSREQFLRFSKYFDPAPKKTPADYPKLWWHLPIVDVMSLAEVPPNDFADVVSRDVTDPWWNQFNYMTDDYRSDVPTLHVNSWYDFGARETIYEFEVMRRQSASRLARDNQFLLISPTTHCRSEFITADDHVGERDVGDARFDYWSMYFNWFARWLMDDADAIASMPRVHYYLMGKNEWRTCERLADTRHRADQVLPAKRRPCERPERRRLAVDGRAGRRAAGHLHVRPRKPGSVASADRSAVRARTWRPAVSTSARSKRATTCSSTRASR